MRPTLEQRLQNIEQHVAEITTQVHAIRAERGEESVVLRDDCGFERVVCVAAGVHTVHVPVPLSPRELMRLWDEPITSIPGPPSFSVRRFEDSGLMTESGKRIFRERR